MIRELRVDFAVYTGVKSTRNRLGYLCLELWVDFTGSTAAKSTQSKIEAFRKPVFESSWDRKAGAS